MDSLRSTCTKEKIRERKEDRQRPENKMEERVGREVGKRRKERIRRLRESEEMRG